MKLDLSLEKRLDYQDLLDHHLKQEFQMILEELSEKTERSQKEKDEVPQEQDRDLNHHQMARLQQAER